MRPRATVRQSFFRNQFFRIRFSNSLKRVPDIRNPGSKFVIENHHNHGKLQVESRFRKIRGTVTVTVGSVPGFFCSCGNPEASSGQSRRSRAIRTEIPYRNPVFRRMKADGVHRRNHSGRRHEPVHRVNGNRKPEGDARMSEPGRLFSGKQAEGVGKGRMNRLVQPRRFLPWSRVRTLAQGRLHPA